MRKGFLIMTIAALLAVQAQAQNINAKRITVSDSIWLNGKWVKGVSSDSTLGEGADNILPTQGAVKKALIAPHDITTNKITISGAVLTKAVTVPGLSASQIVTPVAVYRAMRVDTVSNITQLKNYPYDAYSDLRLIYVIDTMQGGLFYKTSTGKADGGITFPALGGGYWQRYYNRSDGVSIDWFGSRDSYSILKAVAAAGAGGTIDFTPGKTYRQYDAIIPLAGQSFNGNGATLIREPMQFTRLVADAQPEDTFVVVEHIPDLYKTGDYIGIYTDSTDDNLPINYARKITRLNNDTIFISQPLNFEKSNTTTLLADTTKVIKVFHQFTSTVPDSLGSNWVLPLNFTITNLIFDGNKDSTSQNVSWYFNNAVFNMGHLTTIENCKFYNMPSDAINGHGYTIKNCVGKNLNGSFVHLSKNPDLLPGNVGTFITHCYTDSTNLRWQDNGHAKGVIETSNSSGYFIISGNRFYNGLGTVLGSFFQSVSNRSSATRELIFSNNYCKNFASILPSPNPVSAGDYPINPGNIYIYGNVFDSCGNNDLTPEKNDINNFVQGFKIGDNLLTGSTTLNVPALEIDSSSRFIISADHVYGATSFSGDGAATDFNVSISAGFTPSKITITPTSNDAAAAQFYVDKSTITSTQFAVKAVGTTPPTGTNNVSFDYELIR